MLHNMTGFIQYFLLCILIQEFLICGSKAWHVNLLNSIKGLKGSCLVIPCSFDYHQYPPSNPNIVVWYQYVNHGYPVVYDRQHPENVIEKFRGKTSRVGSKFKTCSLEIYPLEGSHHMERIYPWVDPDYVGKSTYAFFDTTVTIEVMDSPKSPTIQIIGNLKVGQEVTVQCTVYHTCSSRPPTLSLNIPSNDRKITHRSMSDGTSRTTLEVKFVIKKIQQTVECGVQHTGGLTSKGYKSLNAKCSFWPLTIMPQSEEFLEGVEKRVTCSVSYTCSDNMPILTWNYERMPASTETKNTKVTRSESISTLMFTPSAKDQGRSLTCYARFAGGHRQETSITLQVKRAMLSRGWSFTAPGSIRGLRGSCVVIPCTFTYTSSQPLDLRVIWYLYQTHGHPRVFDKENGNIEKYEGRTSLVGSVERKNCSLQIKRLEMSHNLDRLYPWVDMNPITSYHTLNQLYFDKTIQLLVSDHAAQPWINVIGIPSVGEESTVSCSVHHTCPTTPPTLSLQDSSGSNHVTHTAVSDGIWQTTIERTWNVTEEDHSVTCTARHPAGQTARTEIKLNVKCPFEKIVMDDKPEELTEGMAKVVICSVSYKCKRNTPTITWNYNDMQSSVNTTKVSKHTYKTTNKLTFIPSLNDNGKQLTCTAQFKHEQTSDSTLLVIKQYEQPVEEIDPHENDTFHVLMADVIPKVSALIRSCVVVPCSFEVGHEPITNLRGIWYNRAGDYVYHNGQSQVLDHFKGRTRILGDLDRQNCTLEIDDIKPFDNGPFCFRAERKDEKYNFNNSCVFIIMRASPEKPVMTQIPEEIDAGSTVNVTCSVTHTCPSHSPVFMWSGSVLTNQVRHTWMEKGTWQTSSTVTFIPSIGDGPKNITCTALFWRGKQRASTVWMNVKGSTMFQLRSILPVLTSTSTVVLIIIILGTVFGVTIWKKRGRSGRSQKPPPRPEKRKSLWDRLSRGHPEGMQRPPRPEEWFNEAEPHHQRAVYSAKPEVRTRKY